MIQLIFDFRLQPNLCFLAVAYIPLESQLMSEKSNNTQTETPDPQEDKKVSLTTEQELENYKKEHLYLRAELENFKQNSIKERGQLIKYGAERLARDLVGVLDIFEKALSLEVNDKNLKSYKEGVELTAKELKKVLNANGIKEIDSLKKKFNPDLHEAMTEIETIETPDQCVHEVFTKGYQYHDRLLRPAQVIVAKVPGA